MRIYEVSKTYKVTSKELVQLLQHEGFEVAGHMSVVNDEALAFLKKHFTPEQESSIPKDVIVEKKVHEKKVLPQSITAQESKDHAISKIEKAAQIDEQPQSSVKSVESVISGVSKTEKKVEPLVTEGYKKPQETLVQRVSEQVLQSTKQEAAESLKKIELAPMAIGDFAFVAKKQISDVILYLLKKGVIASKNQVVSQDVIADLAQHYGLETIKSAPLKTTSTDVLHTASIGEEERLPVIVVVGHVDHGKTTLLDFIRKTRVAAREKGGITQHLGAYQAQTAHGGLVFLDTPGHEAFSLIRVRGVKVADIAVVVIAVDDGVMPQTIEAIRLVQQAQIPLVVALNKVDKVAPQQIEKVKQSLAQYNLVPEEWGGSTIIVQISAKNGTGVDQLLEMLALQAQVLELKTSTSLPVRGFVLEAKREKGLGFVATIICQQGILRLGDHFIAGSVRGKVTVLLDCFGNRLKEAHPSIPVLVSGFEDLPHVGDIFEVVSAQQHKDKQRFAAIAGSAKQTTAIGDKILNLVIKADNVSSLEAILSLIGRLSGKGYNEFKVIHSGIGAINESDITLANGTNALVYGLHVKMESSVPQLIQRLGVLVKVFDIIYKLVEELELVAERGRPVKMVTKKIGEAIVLKVFDIKGLGAIAGAQVKSGIFSRAGKVAVWRGRQKVGGGGIKSLQRDKKPVKEVHSGYECAFLIDGFNEWQVDDRVECFLEVPE